MRSTHLYSFWMSIRPASVFVRSSALPEKPLVWFPSFISHTGLGKVEVDMDEFHRHVRTLAQGSVALLATGLGPCTWAARAVCCVYLKSPAMCMTDGVAYVDRTFSVLSATVLHGSTFILGVCRLSGKAPSVYTQDRS